MSKRKPPAATREEIHITREEAEAMLAKQKAYEDSMMEALTRPGVDKSTPLGILQSIFFMKRDPDEGGSDEQA